MVKLYISVHLYFEWTLFKLDIFMMWDLSQLTWFMQIRESFFCESGVVDALLQKTPAYR